MGMFSRLTDIINANINSLLEKAENPEKMIKLIIQEMEETLVEVRSSAAKNLADKKSLERSLKAGELSVTNWQQKAELAMSKSREDLARIALQEKHKAVEQIEIIGEQLAALNDVLEKVQDDSQRLQDKLSEAKRRQESFLIRQKSAVVRLKAKQQLHSADIEESMIKFERFQQKVDDLEAQVEAYDLTNNKSLESKFKALENEDAVEQELAQMKQKTVNA